MQTQRGMLFLQLSSATLVLVATALYQGQNNRQGSPKEPSSAQRSTAVYERYVSALQLLESNQPLSALELLGTCSHAELRTTNRLMREEPLPLSSGVLFLRLGTLLGQHASRAAQGGSFKQALLLREACLALSQQLARSGYEEEDATDRLQRLQVIRFLQRQARLPQAETATIQIS